LTCEALGRAERVNHRIGNAANAANIERNRPICIALNWPAKTLAQGNVSANAATDIRPKRYACISTEAAGRESAWFMAFRLW